ncbi:MAG: DEAD/DEAH box helicase, partial [Desulfurococcaceae archaeon]
LIKLISPWFKQDLSAREREALERAGAITAEGHLSEDRLREIFDKINFYEYAPPYGIKRYIEREGKLQPLEPIGHCDLVEKFQPGCIDYGEEGLVVALEQGKTSRLIKSVVEKRIREIDFKSHDGLAQALEEYRYSKLKWSESPHIIKDLLAGRVTSEMMCIVYTPRNGFGRYTKVPERCIWVVRSERPKYVLARGKPLVYYDKRAIYVPMPIGGEYRDFTYGFTYSIDTRENTDLVRLGLALIMVAVRRFLGIPFETIMYDVAKIGEYKYFSLHEPESAGIIEKIDWLGLRKIVGSYSPDDLDRVLISQIDDIAYSTLVTIDFNWDIVKETAVRVIDYILARDKIKALVKGVEVAIPRPSPALKIISFATISEVLESESLMPSLLTALGVYDGSEFWSEADLYPPIPFIKPPQSLLDLESFITDKVLYEDYKLLVESRESAISQLKQSNLRRLVSLIEGSRESSIDLSDIAKNSGIGKLSVEEVATVSGLSPVTVSHATIRSVLGKVREHKRILEREKGLILKYIEEKCRSLYIAYLVVDTLSRQGSIKDLA